LNTPPPPADGSVESGEGAGGTRDDLGEIRPMDAVGGAVAVALRSFGLSVGGRTLLRDVSLEIPAGQITVIVGASGAGKSVLLRVLAGLVGDHDGVIRSSGEIWIGEAAADGVGSEGQQVAGERLASASPGDGSARVGVVFQNYALLDQWSAEDNVRLAIDHRADLAVPPEQSAAEWLSELGVPAATEVGVLSGGQKQRLAIARALAGAPALLLYDEPTSGLDGASGRLVAERIRQTQRTHQRTSIIVTHDYATLLPIADRVLLLDPETQTLAPVALGYWDDFFGSLLKPAGGLGGADEARAVNSATADSSAGDAMTADATGLAGAGLAGWLNERLAAIGRGVLGGLGGAWMRPGEIRIGWVLRFAADYLRSVTGPSAIVYLGIAGGLLGFTATYFSIQFLPYRVYTKPLLLEDLLAAIGFALYRILVPVLATILVAARCGAAVAADVGVKRYGSQIEALRTLGISPTVYLQLPILAAFVIGTPLLTAIAFQVARAVSVLCFTAMHPELGPYFWHPHFHSRIGQAGVGLAGGWFAVGWGDPGWRWVLLKTVLCGVGVGWISYYRGSRPQRSAGDVSDSITSTVLWATLFVLVVHFAISLIEFRSPT